MEALLGQHPYQTQTKLAKSLVGFIHKQGNWVPPESKPRDVEKKFFTSVLLIEILERKVFFSTDCDWIRRVDILR